MFENVTPSPTPNGSGAPSQPPQPTNPQYGSPSPNGYGGASQSPMAPPPPPPPPVGGYGVASQPQYK